MTNFDVIIVGGGASGFFAGINIAKKCPQLSVAILEKSTKLLSKVKVSGGGRCNVTHNSFDPGFLVKNYPRGEKKLYDPFKKFNPGNVINWFDERGLKLKVEGDNRIFPESNSSQTIIDCFLSEAQKYNVKIITSTAVDSIASLPEGFELKAKQKQFICKYLVVSCGSSKPMMELFQSKGYKIEPTVPSLFTFNIDDPRIKDLPGISFSNTVVKVVTTKLIAEGPLLITHWGLSGPAILRLSAWGAKELAHMEYNFSVQINFTGGLSYEDVRAEVNTHKESNPKKRVYNYPLFGLPKRFWSNLLTVIGIREEVVWSEMPKKGLNKLVEELAQGAYKVCGKSTFKEEFVTCGGIDLSEIDLDTFESKRDTGLFVTGEFLNIDAITGGFNFQSCWTSAWLVSEEIERRVK